MTHYGRLYNNSHFSPRESSHGQKVSQMTQFYKLTHFDVFCVGAVLCGTDEKSTSDFNWLEWLFFSKRVPASI